MRKIGWTSRLLLLVLFGVLIFDSCRTFAQQSCANAYIALHQKETTWQGLRNHLLGLPKKTQVTVAKVTDRKDIEFYQRSHDEQSEWGRIRLFANSHLLDPVEVSFSSGDKYTIQSQVFRKNFLEAVREFQKQYGLKELGRVEFLHTHPESEVSQSAVFSWVASNQMFSLGDRESFKWMKHQLEMAGATRANVFGSILYRLRGHLWRKTLKLEASLRWDRGDYQYINEPNRAQVETRDQDQ